MSISAMKQALEALENVRIEYDFHGNPADEENKMIEPAITALRQAIAEAEKQEPIFYVIQATDRFGEGYGQTYWEDPLGFPVYTRPVHAIDISQERVDETAKREHEWVGLMDEEVIAASIAATYTDDLDAWTFARAIEAKLKEKNT